MPRKRTEYNAIELDPPETLPFFISATQICELKIYIDRDRGVEIVQCDLCLTYLPLGSNRDLHWLEGHRGKSICLEKTKQAQRKEMQADEERRAAASLTLLKATAEAFSFRGPPASRLTTSVGQLEGSSSCTITPKQSFFDLSWASEPPDSTFSHHDETECFSEEERVNYQSEKSVLRVPIERSEESSDSEDEDEIRVENPPNPCKA
ncbi:hypothetical protein NLJ89_g12241 [Agrocybe chaxingu]|uniref:Uncharacterized protein n=1 Tax=Agrocybe chaxingu TaxID=84603 RepID=A0A9W8JUT7_9AGAR|nr:hypothetical protein NLJ89_g12241 [Agrocybe chaxingu]